MVGFVTSHALVEFSKRCPTVWLFFHGEMLKPALVNSLILAGFLSEAFQC